MSRAGRNDPCPCGSGKKYKKCCQLKGGVGARYSRTDRDLALVALEEFVDGPGWREIVEDATAEFWDDLDPEGTPLGQGDQLDAMSEQVFDWWLFFGFELDDGRRIVDAFLEVAQNLLPGMRAYLSLARQTKMWVYQVTEVRPGAGMTLRDVVTGKETRVVERTGTREVRRWDVIGTRIMPDGVSGDPVLDGGILPIPPYRVESITEFLRDFVDDVGGDLEDPLVHDIAPDVHRAWIEPMPMPRLVNYDGEAMLLTHVYFDARDPGAVTSALDGDKALERCESAGEPPRWSWSGTGKQRKEPVIYGWFSLRGNRLELMTNSAERGERGRKLIARRCGDTAKYRVTRTQDPKQAMDAMREGERPEPPSLPEEYREAARATVEQHLTEHYERWLEEPIPRLGDATPREAARSAEARPRLVEMLKELEGMYEKALAGGEAAFDPTWMWEELDLASHRDAPIFRKAAPVLGHESIAKHLPELRELGRDVAERIRRAAGTKDLTRVVSEGDLAGDLAYQRFARSCPSPEFARHAVTTLANFELYLRKVFWVGEPLAWMLGATRLDVTGEAVRPPFRSIALVFTDRYALGLAERMDSLLPEELRLGRMLQILTVYVTEVDDRSDPGRMLDLTFVGDVLDGTRPTIVPCRLELPDAGRLSELLRRASPGIADLDEDETVRPLYESAPLRDLLGLVVNALLYATSADAEAHVVEPGANEQIGKGKSPSPTSTSETVFHLPGTIDIQTLRQVKKARRGGRDHELSRRCMVRGHWRRAQEGWEDQRPRWIKPHWRGPSAAAIVERQYRLNE